MCDNAHVPEVKGIQNIVEVGAEAACSVAKGPKSGFSDSPWPCMSYTMTRYPASEMLEIALDA